MKVNYREKPCTYCSKIFKPKTSKMKCCGELCRFLSHVKKLDGNNDCWEWTSNIISRSGYGNFCDDNRRFITTHRFSYEKFNGIIPDGMHVLHKCDNRKCVKPEHLFLGTPKDNILDMWKKGRQQKYRNQSKGDLHYSRHSPHVLARGEKHGNSKFTEEQILDIRKRAKSETLESIGKSYNSDKSVIWGIVKRKTWKHVA